MNGLVDKTCQGCLYFAGSSYSMKSCDYILIKKKPRPCPAGAGCTEYVGAKNNRPRIVDPWDNWSFKLIK